MILGDETMESPYMNCPLISQNQDILYTPQSVELPMQQYPQQFMPMPQCYPMQVPCGMPMPGSFGMPVPGSFGMPVPVPYGMNEDTVVTDMGPLTKSPGDPPPLISNNPASASTIIFKELSAYANYGNPSRNADILYTGNRGTWTLETPAFLFVPGNLRARITIRAVLDDHVNVPVNRYSARITINGNVVHDGRVPLEHGTPAGSVFTNWRDLTFNITTLRRITRVTIENTSTAGPNDWIGLDWMEVRFLPR